MNFIPDGWLPSFSAAAELYDKLRFDERPTSGEEPEARIFALKQAQRDGQHLTDDEKKELAHLGDEYWLMKMLESFGVTFGEQHLENKVELIDQARRWRKADSIKRLQQRLFDNEIRASILDRDTGNLHPIPGSFWASEQAEKVNNVPQSPRDEIVALLVGPPDCYVRINAFRTARGPALIFEADVIKAAAPASAPPIKQTSAQNNELSERKNGSAKAEREAEKNLRNLMETRRDLMLECEPHEDLPVKVTWVPMIINQTGVSRRGAERAWNKTSELYPELASPKGKRKTKRADLA